MTEYRQIQPYVIGYVPGPSSVGSVRRIWPLTFPLRVTHTSGIEKRLVWFNSKLVSYWNVISPLQIPVLKSARDIQEEKASYCGRQSPKLLILCPEHRGLPSQSWELWGWSTGTGRSSSRTLSAHVYLWGDSEKGVRVKSIWYRKLTEVSQKGTEIPS